MSRFYVPTLLMLIDFLFLDFRICGIEASLHSAVRVARLKGVIIELITCSDK